MVRIVILLACTLWVGSLAAQRTSAVRTPADLMGRSLDEVLATAGVPRAIAATPHSLALTYDRGGRHAVVLHDGVVVLVSPEFLEFAGATPVPVRGLYLGQPVADAMGALDTPATAVTFGERCDTFSFGDGLELALADGRVIGVRTE